MVGLLTFATLILLRLGLPLAATALMVWLLQQLDARWQAEAERQQRATPRVVARVPCWEIRQCPPESRATCPAYAQPDLPCWQVFRDRQGRLAEACLSCQVFRDAPVPVPV